MPIEMHTHSYGGMTTFNSGHVHGYFGETSPNPNTLGHIHFINGITTRNDGHIHILRIPTGPAVYIDGGHYHFYRGGTSVAFRPNRHFHFAAGNTSFYRRLGILR